MFIKALKNKMCDVKMAIFFRDFMLSGTNWFLLVFFEDIVWHWFYIFERINTLPHDSLCFAALLQKYFWRKVGIILFLQEWGSKLKYAFNVLIHQVTLFKMSWDSIKSRYLHLDFILQSLYSASWLCSQSR